MNAIPQPMLASKESLQQVLDIQTQAYFNQGIPSFKQRHTQLDLLAKLLKDNQGAIAQAICDDFGHRAHQETQLAELYLCIDGIRHTQKHLKKWMRPQKRSVSKWIMGSHNTVIPQPLGVVGIVVPWNYPLFLCISPLISAMAAGNRCMIKMAANSKHLSTLMRNLIAENFKDDYLTIVPDTKGSNFSSLAFDHLIFTGSSATGKQVMRAAADNLTPVTLELGGKSPTIIGPDYAIKKACKRLLFAKYLNAGQTCVAPDYVFVPADKVDEFIGAAKAIVNARYPSIEGDDYTSIINDSAYQRLTDTLNDAIAKGAQAISLVENSVANETRRKFPPTALINVTADMQVMREEIFGPLLPIMTYTDMTQVLSYIQTHDRPLALYLFSDDKATQQTVVNKTRSGGVCINDSAVHVGQHDMPFGGVGESGMGQYHGVEGFFAMSKLRPIFTQARFPTLALLYPPYGRTFAGIIKLMIKFKA